MSSFPQILRDKKGKFIKGFKAPTAWKKGHISWSKGKKAPQLSGINNGRWKGGRFIQDGYWLTMVKNHPKAVKGYVFEHRLVLEKKIGRFLNSNEITHHINGNRLDNRPENLELINRAEHAKIHLKGKKRSMEIRKKISEAVKKHWIERKKTREIYA